MKILMCGSDTKKKLDFLIGRRPENDWKKTREEGVLTKVHLSPPGKSCIACTRSDCVKGRYDCTHSMTFVWVVISESFATVLGTLVHHVKHCYVGSGDCYLKVKVIMWV